MSDHTTMAMRAAFYALHAERLTQLAAELEAGDETAVLVCGLLEQTAETIAAQAADVRAAEANRLAKQRRLAAA